MAIDQSFMGPIVPIIDESLKMQGSLGSLIGLPAEAKRMASSACDLLDTQVKAAIVQLNSKKDLDEDQLLASQQARELQAKKVEFEMRQSEKDAELSRKVKLMSQIDQETRSKLALKMLAAMGEDVSDI